MSKTNMPEWRFEIHDAFRVLCWRDGVCMPDVCEIELKVKAGEPPFVHVTLLGELQSLVAVEEQVRVRAAVGRCSDCGDTFDDCTCIERVNCEPPHQIEVKSRAIGRTAEPIKALRLQAIAAGDREMEALCDGALSGDDHAKRECLKVLEIMNQPHRVIASGAVCTCPDPTGCRLHGMPRGKPEDYEHCGRCGSNWHDCGCTPKYRGLGGDDG